MFGCSRSGCLSALRPIRLIAAMYRHQVAGYHGFGVALLGAVLLCCAPVAAAQTPTQSQDKRPQTTQQDQSLKLKTELVELRAVVTGRKGEIILDLKQSDFELRENGKPREISFFSVETASSGAKPGVTGTEREAPERVGPRPIDQSLRSVVLFVDTLHLSAGSLLRTKQSLKKFVREQLSPDDVVAVIATGGGGGLTGQFTRDRQAIAYAIDRLSVWSSSTDSLFSPYLASRVAAEDREATGVAISIMRAEEGIDGPPDVLRSMAQGRASQVLAQASNFRRICLSALRQVIDSLSQMPGQRIVALFSDGFSLQDTGGSVETNEVRSVISRATRAAVTIYSFDARGLHVSPLFDASTRAMPSDPLALSRIDSYVRAGEEETRDGINALASDTGGEAFFNTNDISGSLKKALDENQAYYSIAYYPGTEDKKDFRRIELKVKGHPEYHIRSQRGYFAADLTRKAAEELKTPQQKLKFALEAALPSPALAVSSFPYFFHREGSPSDVVISVHIAGEKLGYRAADTRQQLHLDIWTVVFDSDGRSVSQIADTVTGSVSTERLPDVRAHGFKYIRAMTIKPGYYQVRVCVYDYGSGLVGSAFSWLEVPDVAKGKLRVSSIVLSDPMAEKAGKLQPVSDQSRERIKEGMRVYAMGDQLLYQLAVYNAAAKEGGASDVQMKIEIVQDEKVEYQGDWYPVSSRVVDRDKRAQYLAGTLKLNGLDTGMHELRVSVRQGAKKPIVQKAMFLINR